MSVQDFDEVRARTFTLITTDAKGVAHPICSTSVGENSRGDSARVTTQFAPGIPAESETIPGKGAFKPGTILIQHQFHDGRDMCRLGISGNVDMAGGLGWNIDSTTTADYPDENAAPLTINVGGANGDYEIHFADGRRHYVIGGVMYETTLQKITEMLARQE
jgi:hypothetical protein